MDELDMQTLKGRLTRIMQERDLIGRGSQRRLAELAGATKGAANQWMNGLAESIKLEFAVNLERELGFDHQWIMTGEGRVYTSQPRIVPPALPKDETVLWDEILELMVLFRGTTKLGRDTILSAARRAPKRTPGSATSNDDE